MTETKKILKKYNFIFPVENTGNWLILVKTIISGSLHQSVQTMLSKLLWTMILDDNYVWQHRVQVSLSSQDADNKYHKLKMSF